MRSRKKTSAIPFELTNSDNILLVRLSGVFTAPELNRLTDLVEIVEASCPASFDRLTDLTAVERFEVGFREIYCFAIRRSKQQFSTVVKSAIVVQETAQLEIARTYEALNGNPQITVRILESEGEAMDWIVGSND